VSKLALTIAIPLFLAACANGDFDRVRPSLVTDNIHAWVGRDAARDAGAPISAYPLTDNERRLRDLAYPLIEPPYDRNRWYSIVGEYGVSHFFQRDWASTTRQPITNISNIAARARRRRSTPP
jgi:hypothetical protein